MPLITGLNSLLISVEDQSGFGLKILDFDYRKGGWESATVFWSRRPGFSHDGALSLVAILVIVDNDLVMGLTKFIDLGRLGISHPSRANGLSSFPISSDGIVVDFLNLQEVCDPLQNTRNFFIGK